MPDWTDEALSGLDRARPLSAGLRHRLQEALAAEGAAEAIDQMPLDDALSARLRQALEDPLAPLLLDVDSPRPLPLDARRRLEDALSRPRRRWPMVSAAAAAVVLVGGVAAVVAVAGGGSPPPTRAISHPPLATTAQTPPAGASAVAPLAGPGPANGTSTVNPATGTPDALGGSSSAAATAEPQTAAVPAVSTLSPSSGPASGGTWVTITGSGFDGATAVVFGARPAHFVVTSPDTIRAQAPPQSPGTVDVAITGPRGRSAASSTCHFLYR